MKEETGAKVAGVEFELLTDIFGNVPNMLATSETSYEDNNNPWVGVYKEGDEPGGGVLSTKLQWLLDRNQNSNFRVSASLATNNPPFLNSHHCRLRCSWTNRVTTSPLSSRTKKVTKNSLTDWFLLLTMQMAQPPLRHLLPLLRGFLLKILSLLATSSTIRCIILCIIHIFLSSLTMEKHQPRQMRKVGIVSMKATM